MIGLTLGAERLRRQTPKKACSGEPTGDPSCPAAVIDGGTTMGEHSTLKSLGIASLFENRELKSFFKSYLSILFGIELLIFFVSFICQLKPIDIPFPWRYYLLASFLAPIVITFVMGVVVKAFNLFCFGMADPATPPPETEQPRQEEEAEAPGKLNAPLRFFHQVPFLFTLLMLILLALFLSQVDQVISYVGAVGEKAVIYGLTVLGVLVFIATGLAVFWLVIKYKLEKLRYQYEYKKELMIQQGVFGVEDEKMIDQDGRIISMPPPGAKQIVPVKSRPQ